MNVGENDPAVSVLESSNNLFLGQFASAVVTPAPLATDGDQWIPAASVHDMLESDFRPVPGAYVDGTGKNLSGNALYGDASVDLYGTTRSKWSRGACE